MGYLANVYNDLAKEAEQRELYEKKQKRNSLYQKSFNLIGKTLGLGPVGSALLPIGAGMTGAIGIGEKILHNSTGAAIDAVLYSPFLLNRLQKIASTQKHFSETTHNLQTNFEDYNKLAQTKHLARTVASLGYAGAGLGGLTALIGSSGGLFGMKTATHIAALNPASLLFKGLSGAGHFVGSGISALTGIPGMNIAGTILATLMSGKLISSINNKLFTKQSRITIPQVHVPGIQDIIKFSTYNIYLNKLQLYQSQGILKPNEIIIASLLNEINLNTAALIPIYSKLLSNEKDVKHQTYTQELFDKLAPEKFNKTTKGELQRRKTTYYFLRNLELDITESLYKIAGPLMRLITGKKYKDFLNEKHEILDLNDRKRKTIEQSARAIKVPSNLYQAFTRNARDFLNAPTYEDKMLGLVANIHELLRLNIDLKIKDSKVRLKNFNKNFPSEKDLTFFNRIKKSISSFFTSPDNPIGYFGQLVGSTFKTGKSIYNKIKHGNFTQILDKSKSLKERFLETLNFTSPVEIEKTFNKNLNKFSKNFDVKKSTFDYLGKQFPDHMIEIIHQLQQQTTYLHDMLNCWNCSSNTIKKTNKKWRGGFGEFLDEDSFISKLFKKTKAETIRDLNITRRTIPDFSFKNKSSWNLASIFRKISSVDKKELNPELDLLNELAPNHLIYRSSISDLYKTPAFTKNTKNNLNKLKLEQSTTQFKKELKEKNLSKKFYNAIFKIKKYLYSIKQNTKCYIAGLGLQCKDGKALNKINFGKSKINIAGAGGSLLDFFKEFLDLFRLGKKFSRGIGKILRKVLKPLESFTKIFKKETWGKIGEKLLKYIPKLGKIGVLVNLTKDMIAKIFKIPKKIVSGLVGFFKKFHPLNWVGDKAKKALNWIGDKAKIVKDWVGDKAKKALNWVGDKAKTIKNSVTGFFGGISDKFKEGWNWISGKAKTAFKTTKKFFGRAATKIKDFFVDPKLERALEKPGFIKRFFKKIGEKLLLKGFKKEFVTKLIERLGAAGLGFLAGGIPGIILTIVDIISYADLAYDIAQAIYSVYKEMVDGKPNVSEKASKEAVQEINSRPNPHNTHTHPVQHISIQNPRAHRNRLPPVLPNQKPLTPEQAYYEDTGKHLQKSKFIVKNNEKNLEKIIASLHEGLAQLAGLLSHQTQNQDIQNQLLLKLIQTVKETNQKNITILPD